MLLVADIGNTNITIGIFNDDKIVENFSLPSDIKYTTADYCLLLKQKINSMYITGCIIATVANGLDTVFSEAVESVFCIKSLIFSKDMNLGIKLKTNNAVGADRIINCVAISSQNKYPAIVIDIGTAITFDIINAKNEFIGGIIAPGINIQLKSLNQYTSKLPLLTPYKIFNFIGNNTQDAIMSGVIGGIASMIDGMIERCKKELKETPKIILTGGNCKLISKYMQYPYDEINQKLTLHGLKVIYKLNSNL